MENTTNSNKSNSIISEEGLAFDDVLLVPQYSEILPAEVILTTKLTKNIELKTPILHYQGQFLVEESVFEKV